MLYWQWEDKISQQTTKRGTIFKREDSVLMKFLDIINGFTEKKIQYKEKKRYSTKKNIITIC